MPQEINVNVIRKQITEKLSAIETATEHNKIVSEKISKIREDNRAAFEKEHTEWERKLAKVVAKAVTADNIRVTNSRYNGVSVEISNVAFSEVGEEPRFDYNCDAIQKLEKTYKEVPKYYDNRGNELYNLGSIIFHYKKALALLDALPNGTATVTVKDFDFLTRY
jgi:hypothetical protein